MKKNLIIFTLLLALIQSKTYSQTEVSGTIYSNTTWTIENSPYSLTDHFTISENVTLTIDPGVEIEGDFDILVKEGAIILNGEPDSKINIKNSCIYFWGTDFSKSSITNTIFDESGIKIAEEQGCSVFATPPSSNCHDTLRISNCDFKKYSYINDRQRCDPKTPYPNLLISNTVFDNSDLNLYSKLNLDKCIISYTKLNGIWRSINMINSQISNSELNGFRGLISNSKLQGINISNLESGWNLEIEASQLIDCNLEMVCIKLDINNNIIINTKFNIEQHESSSFSEGIININKSLFVSNNTDDIFTLSKKIQLNINRCSFIQNNYYTKGSIFSGDQVSLNVFESTFDFNNTVFNGTDLTADISVVFENSNFTRNLGFAIIAGKYDINASYNYWNVNSSQIPDYIYDKDDEVTLGNVYYSNNLVLPDIIAPISKPEVVNKYMDGENLVIIWKKNPENDLSGYKIYYNRQNEFSFNNVIDLGNDTVFISSAFDLSDEIVISAYDNLADGINDQTEGHESWYSSTKKMEFNLESGSSYCVGENIEYSLKANGIYAEDNEFILELSDSNGRFDTPTELGTVQTNKSFLSTIPIPAELLTGNEYLIRLKSPHPVEYSNTKVLTVYSIPSSDFIISSDKICHSEIASISYNGTATDNANYTWNFDEGSKVESSDQNNYEISWNSPGIKKVGLSVSENGCNSSEQIQSIKVYQPNSSFHLNDHVCDNENTTVSFTGTASDSATFQWYFDNADITSGGINTKGPHEINWDTEGAKNISLLIDDNGCLSSQKDKTIKHSYTPTASFELPERACFDCPTSIVYTGNGANNATFDWFFNNGIQTARDENIFEVRWPVSGQRNISLIVSQNGCSSEKYIQSIIVNEQTKPISICQLNTDSLNRNTISWQQPVDNVIDSILIYRQSLNDDSYEIVGKQLAKHSSVFTDMKSNPTSRAYKYKVAALDTCDYITPMSNFHKSLHLTLQKGEDNSWVLTWDPYIGIFYGNYYIYRGTSEYELEKISELSNFSSSFTEQAPPTGRVYYQIGTESQSSCIPFNDNLQSNSNNIILSNKVSSDNTLSLENFIIWPNPASSKLYVKDKYGSSDFKISILSPGGKEIMSKKNSNTKLKLIFPL